MSDSPATSPEILAALAAKANADGFIELPDFIETALYHPQYGYYCQKHDRIGRNAQSDFFTSLSLREAFSEIVVEAACSLLEKAGLSPADTHWVEIGAEPGGTLLGDNPGPFKTNSAIGIGTEIAIPSQAVVFSNELFDAQPFRQIRFDGQHWVEYGVRLEDSQAQWHARSSLSLEAEHYLPQLPNDLPAGYTIDLPTGSNQLAASIAARDWSGVFIAFDYGKTWLAMSTDTPQGSARGYFRHQQKPDILEAPGSIDITHHICWDPLEAALESNNFEQISLQSQEAFIVHRAPRFLQKAFDPNLPALAPIRQKLKELMHPALMGQKFQSLCATRAVQPSTSKP